MVAQPRLGLALPKTTKSQACADRRHATVALALRPCLGPSEQPAGERKGESRERKKVPTRGPELSAREGEERKRREKKETGRYRPAGPAR